MKSTSQYEEWEHVPSNTKPKHKDKRSPKKRETKRLFEEQDDE